MLFVVVISLSREACVSMMIILQLDYCDVRLDLALEASPILVITSCIPEYQCTPKLIVKFLNDK